MPAMLVFAKTRRGPLTKQPAAIAPRTLGGAEEIADLA